MATAGQSVSRIPFVIEISGKGVMGCEMTRHTSPLTCSTILKNLPIQDRIHRMKDDFIYAESKLVIGPEKQRTSFKQQDIGFMTANGSICVFIKDANGYKMNLIGKVTSNFELAASVGAGDTMIVRLG